MATTKEKTPYEGLEVPPIPAPEIKVKPKVVTEIYRKNGKTFFKFEIDQKIEELYREHTGEIRTSERWPGLKFYFIPEVIDNEEYRQKLQYHRLFDDYGQDIYVDGKLNIAWLRTVGGKGEIQIKNPLSFAELSVLSKNSVQFVKEYFEDYFRDFRIKGSVTLEV